MKKRLTKRFRAGVGAVIMNKKGRVLAFERRDTPGDGAGSRTLYDPFLNSGAVSTASSCGSQGRKVRNETRDSCDGAGGERGGPAWRAVGETRLRHDRTHS